MADPSIRPTERSATGSAIALLANPATSDWLKHAIMSALDRDPFDAECDALKLSALLTDHVDELVARHLSERPASWRAPYPR